MKITDKTLYTDLLCIEKYIPDAEREKLIQASQQRYKEYYNLTIAEFFALLDKDYTLIEYSGNSEQLTALQYFFMQGFTAFVAELQTIFEKLTLKPTFDEQRNMAGVLPMTFSESIIVFVQDFFGLKSYSEAENITLADVVLAKKVHYNRSIYQRNTMKNLKLKKPQ